MSVSTDRDYYYNLQLTPKGVDLMRIKKKSRRFDVLVRCIVNGNLYSSELLTIVAFSFNNFIIKQGQNICFTFHFI